MTQEILLQNLNFSLKKKDLKHFVETVSEMLAMILGLKCGNRL